MATLRSPLPGDQPRTGPVFKKPVHYDPTLAERTLQASYSQSEVAKQAKKRSMLAELVRHGRGRDGVCERGRNRAQGVGG